MQFLDLFPGKKNDGMVLRNQKMVLKVCIENKIKKMQPTMLYSIYLVLKRPLNKIK